MRTIWVDMVPPHKIASLIKVWQQAILADFPIGAYVIDGDPIFVLTKEEAVLYSNRYEPVHSFEPSSAQNYRVYQYDGFAIAYRLG